MKRTALFLFSLCALLLPHATALAQNAIFRQNEFPTLDSLLRHEHYADGARLAEGQRGRVAQALDQSPLKPDTLPEAQVIDAFNRWVKAGRAPMLSRMRVERLTYRGQTALNFDLHDARVSRTFLQAADMPLLRSAAAPSLPLSQWLLEETDARKGTARLYWTAPQPEFCLGLDTAALRQGLASRYDAAQAARIPATWYTGRLFLHLDYWDYCGTAVCEAVQAVNVKRGQATQFSSWFAEKGNLAYAQYYKDGRFTWIGDLPLEAYYGGAELKLLAEMIRLQLGADWDEVRDGLGFNFCLLFTTRADGRLSVKVIKPGNSTQPTAQTQAARKLAQAVSALPPHLMGSLLTTDGHVFPYRLIAGRPIGISPDNPYRHKWVLTDCLYCASWKEVEKKLRNVDEQYHRWYTETKRPSMPAGDPQADGQYKSPITLRQPRP